MPLVLRLGIAAAVIVALVQISTSWSGGLSRWKGGGFGMYTEPHPVNRRVWLIVVTEFGRFPALLSPMSNTLLSRADSPEERAALREMKRNATLLGVSGRQAYSTAIKNYAEQIVWSVQDGVVTVDETAPAAVTDYAVEVYEIRYEVSHGRIFASEIFSD